MEYFREPHNKIQAGFALHVGKLLAQYGALARHQRDNCEATLLICSLQSLLTICKELITATREHKKELWSAAVCDIPGWLGITCRHIRKDTFHPCLLTYARFMEHLRNAVSHPTSADKKPFHPSTGYTTIPDGSGIISRFLFTDSPWVYRGKIGSRWCSPSGERVSEEAKRFERKYTPMTLTVKQGAQGRYEIFRENKVYIPIFEAEFTIQSLKSLTIEFSNFLAQPTREDWDGETIQRLVA